MDWQLYGLWSSQKFCTSWFRRPAAAGERDYTISAAGQGFNTYSVAHLIIYNSYYIGCLVYLHKVESVAQYIVFKN
jgi:hypothetical protein